MVRSLIEGKTSQQLRTQYVDQHVVPAARRAFRRDAKLRSVVVAVGQFYCDEAYDATHIELLPCVHRDPVWPDMLRDSRYFCIDEDFPDAGELNKLGNSLTGYDATLSFPTLDSNTTSIVAFAAYCIEACHQEMSMAEAFTPYAIARRSDSDGVDVEVVGTILQPHWEDRFDVGFMEKVGRGTDSSSAADMSRPQGLLGFLKRLF